MPLLTQSQYAKYRNISRQAVSKAVKEGRIALVNGLVDPAVADAAFERVGEGTGVSVAGIPAIAESKAAQAAYDARTAKLIYEQKSGKLVDAAAVEEVAFNRAREEREAWENWPLRISANLAHELGVDEVKLRTLLIRELKSHLEERSSLEIGSLLEKAS